MIGGGDGIQRLSTVDVFDMETMRSSATAPMTFPRDAHCSCTSDSRIFVFGSMGDQMTSEATFNCEYYEPQTRRQVSRS